MEGVLGILVVLVATVSTTSATGNGTDPCIFGPGICPVTIDNVLDIFYFDVADSYSCQERCTDTENCHFFR